MRSSRSHTGPRPLSDFTYIDEDPTNSSGQSAAKLPSKGTSETNQEREANYRGGSRIQSQNSSASPLLLTVTGPANAYNHHYTTNTTNDNRPTSNYPSNQAHSQPNHALQSSNNRDSTWNSLLLSSNNLPVSDISKVVHETSI